MPEIAVRVPSFLPDVDWSEWRAAGVTCVHAPEAAWGRNVRTVAAAGLEPVIEVDFVPAPGAHADVPRGTSVCLLLSPGVAPAEGEWWGAARVAGLDVLAAQLDDELVLAEAAGAGVDGERARTTLRRYRRARECGYARAELPAAADAVALLLGDDAEPLVAALATVVARAVREAAAQARAQGAERVLLEADPAAPAQQRLLALAPAVDRVLVPVEPSLPQLLRAFVDARAAGATGAVMQMPADHLRTPEELADVLDLLDGAGCRSLLLASNPGWLAIGAPCVARAVARLHGRPGPLDHERQRRTEVREA